MLCIIVAYLKIWLSIPNYSNKGKVTSLKKAVISSLGIVLSMTGCTAVQYNGSEVSNVKAVDYPTIGSVQTAFVGDHLVSRGILAEMEILKVTKAIESVAYDIPPGSYPQIGYDQKQTFYSPIGVVKAALADPYTAISVNKGDMTEACIVTVFGLKSCMEAYGKIEVERQLSHTQNSFQQTLIYSGKVGDRINISYREFSNQSARPAFNNEAEYDLSESNIIGYKGAEIQVIEATNTSITYKLLSNFPQ